MPPHGSTRSMAGTLRLSQTAVSRIITEVETDHGQTSWTVE